MVTPSTNIDPAKVVETLGTLVDNEKYPEFLALTWRSGHAIFSNAAKHPQAAQLKQQLVELIVRDN